MNEIERLVGRIDAGTNVGVLSCGEQIAAAFLYNRMDWLPDGYLHPLAAWNRLGSSWREMVMDYYTSTNP